MNFLFKYIFGIPKTSAAGGSTGVNNVNLVDPLNTNSITGVISNVTSFLVTIGGIIVAIMIIIGGFQMLFAGGSPEKFKTGQKTILYSVIGFVVILLARGVAAIIQAIATNTTP